MTVDFPAQHGQLNGLPVDFPLSTAKIHVPSRLKRPASPRSRQGEAAGPWRDAGLSDPRGRAGDPGGAGEWRGLGAWMVGAWVWPALAGTMGWVFEVHPGF